MEFELQTLRTILIDVGIFITTLVVFYRNQHLDGSKDVVIFAALLLVNSLFMYYDDVPSWVSHLTNMTLLLSFSFCYTAMCRLLMVNVSWNKILPILIGYIIIAVISDVMALSPAYRVFYSAVACVYLSIISMQLLRKNRRNITSPSNVYLTIIFGVISGAFGFRVVVFLIPNWIPDILDEVSIMILSNLFMFLAFGLLILIFEVINKKLLHLSEQDYLAGIYNRRGFFQALRKVDNSLFDPYVLAIIDVDHFKNINDNYGHSAGDYIIKFIADSLTELSQSKDIIGRFGGEEFCLLLNNKDQNALKRLEIIRSYFEHKTVRYHSTNISFTISIGCVNTRLIHDDLIQKLLVFADISLYQAKNSGRNKVTCFDDMAKI